jgi:NADPH:quinone reductase-like Zn-dependent oxidoreductase
VGASLPISGLTAWQGLFQHGRLQAGQSVLVHGAAGAVGSMVTQLAREFGAHVIGTGRAADRQAVLDFGAQEFVDLGNEALKDVGKVDLVVDGIGGDIGKAACSIPRLPFRTRRSSTRGILRGLFGSAALVTVHSPVAELIAHQFNPVLQLENHAQVDGINS